MGNISLLTELNTTPWLIPEQWAKSNAQLIASVLTGKTVSPFGNKKEDNASEPQAIKKINSHVVVDRRDIQYFGREIPENSIFELSIEGPIFRSAECAYGAIDYANWFNMAAANRNVIGATIKINSPGGSAYGTQLVVQAIKNFQSQGKPVIAYINDGQASSAAYWIVSTCDEVYLSTKTDIVGSIGAYTTLYDFTGWLKKQGITEHQIYAPQSTEKNKDYREAIKGNYKPIQEQLAKMVDEFISQVKAGRQVEIDDIATKGAIFMGTDGIDAGLADGIENYGYVLDRVKSLAAPTQNTNSNQSTMFGNKYKALNALKGVSEPTAEQIAAANTELEEAGFKSVILTTTAEVNANADTAKKVETLESQVSAITTERDTLKTRNTELEAWAEEAGAEITTTKTNKADAETKKEEEEQLLVNDLASDPLSQSILKKFK